MSQGSVRAPAGAGGALRAAVRASGPGVRAAPPRGLPPPPPFAGPPVAVAEAAGGGGGGGGGGQVRPAPRAGTGRAGQAKNVVNSSITACGASSTK
ncbi:hypothetical protein GCM10018781_75250 [Kitasatospora indigofera]|uniref:Uncharacterized protein n=1 Tax=Kitasatospora indigofera TaxID=67307 RepID=A0A918YUS7_9ACTN|nr:hypothetical protein GCM10018781_75250 [Kitasatospora indigofera]